jgi:hypothetical protein
LTGSSHPITTTRVERAEAKKRRKPLVLLIVPLVLVGLGVGVLFALGGGTDAIPIIGGGGQDDEVPAFDFKERKAIAIPTAEEFDKDALAAQAAQIGSEITPILDDLFTNAFLDPTNWREGDYEEVFEAFTPEALASAQQQLDAITLGTTAGDVFEDVEPDKGSLEYRVLFDPENAPHTVVVRYRFWALAERKDGTYLAVFSHGQLTLRPVDGWKVVHFEFIRADREAEPPAATGATGATGAAPTGATGGS